MKWYTKAIFHHYADFKGRARRKEYWMFILVNAIILIVFKTLNAQLANTLISSLVGLVYTLALILPSLAVGTRRLHDINKSAYQLFWGLLPIIGWIVLIVFTVRKGDTGDNPYGADPLL